MNTNANHTKKAVVSKMEHTHGPWRIANGEWVLGPKTNGREQRIARVLDQWGEIDYQNSRANAALIASAPAMLEALRECVSYMHHESRSPFYAPEVKATKQALAAIAKAEGKE
jgi:hypothetical protein